MKVAFVLGTSTGGTARHVRTLAAGCAPRGVMAGVFGPEQTDRDFGFSRLAGGQVSFTPVDIADRPRVARDLRAIRRLRRLLAAWRPDVAHAHGLRAGALTAIALAFVRPTVYHPRPALVVTVHNAPPAGGAIGAVYRVLERIVASRADSVLCVSPDLEERMRTVGARRGRVVHRDDKRGPPVVDGGPDERQRDPGERAGPQAMGVRHVRPPCGEQPAQPPDRPQVMGDARPVRDLDRGEGDLTVGQAAETEVAVSLHRAEHPRRHAPRRAAGREHPDVPGGSAGAGAEHERDLHSATLTARPS